MTTDLEKEYDTHFRKFYKDFFKYLSGSKSAQNCKGCSSKKRFIFGDSELTYSCGPKGGDKKCGPQYTIKLPEYIKFHDLQQIYNEQINGSLNYSENDLLQYDLQSLSKKMNVEKDLKKQMELIKTATGELKKITNEYIEMNQLEEVQRKIQKLSEKRLINSQEKKKIMKQLKDDIPEEKKIKLRKDYALLIRESKEFIPIIQELREPNQSFIMISKPEIIDRTKEPKKKEPEKKEPEKKETSSISKDEETEEYKKQVKILYDFYQKVDPKEEAIIRGIINRRRPSGTPVGTHIPNKPWLALCIKLKNKYKINPLTLEEDTDKFVQELDDGSKILVDSLSPESPK